MEKIRNILEVTIPIVQLTLALICWGAMVYYVIERVKELRNENKTN